MLERAGLERELDRLREREVPEAPSPVPAGPLTVARIVDGLTDLVHLTRKRKKPKTKQEKLAWSTSRTREILPALRSHSAELTVARLVFFARHPDVKGRLKDLPQDRQTELRREFGDICVRLVRPWLTPRIALGAVGTRTLYVVDDPVLKALPEATRDAAGAALADIFAFVGQTRGQAPVTIVFLEPGRFPESYHFADAVVRVVRGKLADHLNQAHQRQRDNARHSIQALRINAVFEPATVFQSVAERLGSAIVFKTVVSAGRVRLAIPIMVAAVDLDAVLSEFTSHYQDEARAAEGRRGGKLDARYWASHQALRDTRTLDNAVKLGASRGKPEAWNMSLQEEFGAALGRTLAHEARHLYFKDADDHAATGLGASDVGDQVVAGRPAYLQFSADDRRNIVAAVGAKEKEQRGATLIATFSDARRASGFPF